MSKPLCGSKWLLIVLGIVFFSFAELKIGYINSDRIINEYQGTKEAQEKFNKEVAKWEQEASERQKEIKTKKEQLDKQSLLLSSERKKELESQLEQELIEYNKFLQEKFGQQGDAVKKNEELLKPIMEKVNKILEKIAKDENYDFIFDGRYSLAYAKKAYDITEKVILILNKEQ